jgi:very-short-patch-repair endonuclease
MADATQPSEAKALRLARYLKDFVGLRATTVHDIDKYEQVLWFGDMPHEPECSSPAWNHDGDRTGPWLEVHKQKFPLQPPAPDAILSWIDQRALSKPAAEMPRLRRGDGARLPPEVTGAYEHYRPIWEMWARECQRRSRIQSLYAELFRMHTQMQKQGEILELVLGFGLLSWRRPHTAKSGTANSPAILRHMVTAQVDLTFDATTGTIRLDCGPDGAGLQIEDDMLDDGLRPAPAHSAAVAEQLRALGDDVWSRSIIMALKSWAAALHPDTEWSPDLKTATAGDTRPLVSFAPALIMRKRAQAGMVRIYDALISRLARDEGAVPQGWSSLVKAAGGADATPFAEAPDSTQAAPEELYFPLPANREQRRIVDVISRDHGVLVQGPPGTGKSHTIANLVCHLLASGKRVLITAETGRALKVLKEKLPEEVRPLCVSLLRQGGDAFAELNAAVQGITTRFASWHEGAYDARIADVDREIESNRRTLAEIDRELRSLREDETVSRSLMNGLYAGTASEIAQMVAAERGHCDWLQLPQDASDDPPVTAADMATWLRIRRAYDNDAIAAAKLRVVATDELPSPADFGAAVAAESDAKAAFEGDAATREHPAYAAILALTDDDREALATKLRELRDSREALRRRGDDRLVGALRAALEGRQAGWLALLEQSQRTVEEIDQLLQRLGSHAISIPDTWDLKQVRADLVVVYRHLREGGKWLEFGLYTPKAIKSRTYLRGPLTVDGQVADTAERLRLVCDHIDFVLSLQALDLAWSDYGGLPPGSQPRIRMAAIKEHIDSFAAALDYAQTCLHLGRILGATTPAIPEPDWLNGEADAFLDLIAAAALDDRYRRSTEEVVAVLRDLKAARDVHGTHPVVGAMIHTIERRDVAGYNHAHLHVQRIEQAVRDLDEGRTIEMAFSAAVPQLADEVAGRIDDPAWDDRFAGWEQAWHSAIADSWLTQRSDAAYLDQLWRRRQEADDDILRLLAEGASLRAWTHFFTRLTSQEAAALRAWREAMRSMSTPGGRPPGMEQLRQEARQYMDRCRDAIPIWIMPRFLVAEMIDPAPKRYDFVIVDESSQLGIDSLFLFYISQKMIVVGDDQQISPYGFGIPERSIADLHHRYLEGIPFHNAFSAQSSLYGNAKIRFAQSVVLREHFRCMPEIIQFSNDLCYATSGTPLDPLRTYPVNRLKPLVTRHVAGGWRTGAESATNEAEAQAILAQILACIADPRYAGRTMGVISLHGEAQAKLIEDKLLQALEPEIYEQRRFMCGDASAFQGDERHIIFLSMVAVPGEPRIAPLSDEQARQRINVAASRAQDQLWLFHSATLDDLSPGCMRHRLLSYMLAPARRTAEEVRHRFDSQLERDVFQMVADRGFRMRTQICIGDPTSHRYRIDIVIEGMQGRLAVECDGDRWNGPERYEEDLARQRDLERAGWQFVRLRGAEFYRDRDAAMEPVWNALDRLGIRPGGFDDAAEEPPMPASNGPDGDNDGVTQAPGGQADAGLHAALGADEDTGIDASRAGGDAERAPAAHPAGAHVADYVAFNGMAGPDPRTATLSEVVDGLCQIIRTEGPMIAKRTYDVYLQGCGIRRLGGELQGLMNQALSTAVGQGRVVCENVAGQGGIAQATVRLPGAPAVRARRRGPRSVDEIPSSEVRAVARRLSAALGLTPGSGEHLRAVIQAMDLPLMLSQVSAMLEADAADPAGAGDSGDRAAE